MRLFPGIGIEGGLVLKTVFPAGLAPDRFSMGKIFSQERAGFGLLTLRWRDGRKGSEGIAAGGTGRRSQGVGGSDQLAWTPEFLLAVRVDQGAMFPGLEKGRGPGWVDLDLGRG